jgi:hypothetical protein
MDRTEIAMLTKAQTAELLAQTHFRLDQGVSRIFRLTGPDESENSDPVKLLEVNPVTTEAGILPIGLGPSPKHGIFYATIVVEVSPLSSKK